MTLIENKDKTEKNIFLDIDATLMFENKCVATVQIHLGRYGFFIEPKQVINKDLLPFPIKFKKQNITNWFTARGFQRYSHRNIFFAEQALKRENRDAKLPFILSLQTNSVSISDKYWINPNETQEFFVNGAKIIFTRTSWDSVNPFKNMYYPREIDEIGLHDIFIFEKKEHLKSDSLIWTTSGAKSKRWIVNCCKYTLEKKLSSRLLKNEIDTLNFFSERNILIPNFTHSSRQINDDEVQFYDINTMNDGLHIISKECVVSDNSYFIPAKDLVENETSIESLITKMCCLFDIDVKEKSNFINAINDYKIAFCVDDNKINLGNFGLLIENTTARFVVLGGLKLFINPVFGNIEEF